MQQHPLSAAFPPMPEADFQALKDSIEAIGVQNPITLFEGMVIDGWHRYGAASELGMECPVLELGDVDPRDFVLAQNKARRHITVAQLAMAATTVYAWRPAGNPALSNSAGPAELKQPEIAKIAGVSVRSLRQAAEVNKTAAPEVRQAIDRGMGLEKAAAIAKLPQAEQAAAITKPLPKPVKVEEPAPEDYTELDAAHDQISELQRELVVARMEGTPEEREQAARLIADLQAEVKTLRAALQGVESSRNGLLNERAQMQRQLNQQRNEIKRMKAAA